LDAPIDSVSLVTQRATSTGAVPDPAETLVKWDSAWPGPIHHFLTRNAQAMPDKTCVVESREAVKDQKVTRWQRCFSYRQIDAASELFAQVRFWLL
jgi:16S rRNA G1207 methylase RsmC